MNVKEAQRHIALEGCFNLRDLGGYDTRTGKRVRWRRLFRSDALHRLTPSDVVSVRTTLGIRTIVDLRSTAELGRHGRAAFVTESTRYHHVPIVEEVNVVIAKGDEPAAKLREVYLDFAESRGHAIARALTIIAEHAADPVVFHCAAGKDRTGIIAAMLLDLLDVDDDVILADYLLTNQTVGDVLEYLRRTPGYENLLRDTPREEFDAHPDAIHGFQAGVRHRHGDVAGYLEAHGADRGLRDRLATALLVDR